MTGSGNTMRDAEGGGFTDAEGGEFTVVIPCLNEAERIGGTLAHLAELEPDLEVIVVDGGSDDDTRALARRAGARVLRAPRGRGVQLHAGAAVARGGVLVFLHADTRLPEQAFAILRRRFADPEVLVGTFRLRFDREHWLLRAYALCTRLDSVLTRFGDQVIAIRRSFYDELGGFPPWSQLEDVHLLRRARRRTRVHSFPASVVTSARRFDHHGLVRTQLRNAALLLGYLCGGVGRSA